VKKCGKDEISVVESTNIQQVQSAVSSNAPFTSSTNDDKTQQQQQQNNNNNNNNNNNTTLLLVNEIGTMMKTMSQIVTTLDLTIVTLNTMYNNTSPTKMKNKTSPAKK
jgi:type VI protein secretion system component VasF